MPTVSSRQHAKPEAIRRFAGTSGMGGLLPQQTRAGVRETVANIGQAGYACTGQRRESVG